MNIWNQLFISFRMVGHGMESYVIIKITHHHHHPSSISMVIMHCPNQSPVTYVSHPMPVIITPSPLINPTSTQQLLNITLEDIIHPAITLLFIFHQNQVYLKVWWKKNGKRKKTHKIHKSQYFMIL